MSLTRQIPSGAGPALDVLRGHKRPKELPSRDHNASVRVNGTYLRPLRWRDIGSDKKQRLFCPLGLYTKAESPCPKPGDVPGVLADVAESFMLWWDEQTDAVAAVEAVWPAL